MPKEYFLSQAVDVPPEHVCARLVTVTRNPDGAPCDGAELLGDLFRLQRIGAAAGQPLLTLPVGR